MSDVKNGEKANWIGFTEAFRIITPILLFILTLYTGSIKSNIDLVNTKLSGMDERMFKHFTNDEIHYPRSGVVDKGQWDLQCKFYDQQMTLILNKMGNLNTAIEKLRDEVINIYIKKK